MARIVLFALAVGCRGRGPVRRRVAADRPQRGRRHADASTPRARRSSPTRRAARSSTCSRGARSTPSRPPTSAADRAEARLRRRLGQVLRERPGREGAPGASTSGSSGAGSPTSARRPSSSSRPSRRSRATTRRASFGGSCPKYAGPALAWFVTACTAPDGSHWAVQRWQRALPNYGLAPNATQSVWELRLSHWTTDLPVLTITMDWSWHRWDHLFGTYTYRGQPVYGFHSTPTGQPLDASAATSTSTRSTRPTAPAGSARTASSRTGAPASSATASTRTAPARPATASKYRATIQGPGVTPDVMWEGVPLGAYDKAADETLNALDRRSARHALPSELGGTESRAGSTALDPLRDGAHASRRSAVAPSGGVALAEHRRAGSLLL